MKTLREEPAVMTHARCTNCSKVYRLFLTKSRTCEHCGHSPVEVVPVTDIGADAQLRR